jgi:hypothetical protein
MRTEPVETYRGVLIYKDTMSRDRTHRSRSAFRCSANGTDHSAEDLTTIKRLIDRDRERGRSN